MGGGGGVAGGVAELGGEGGKLGGEGCDVMRWEQEISINDL